MHQLKSHFTFLVIFLSLACTAQVKIDSFYKTTYYEQKVTLFRQLPDTKGEIIFLGNSITDIGEWAEIWQNLRGEKPGYLRRQHFGVLAALDEVTSSKPG
jgi:hypothetical protein